MLHCTRRINSIPGSPTPRQLGCETGHLTSPPRPANRTASAHLLNTHRDHVYIAHVRPPAAATERSVRPAPEGLLNTTSLHIIPSYTFFGFWRAIPPSLQTGFTRTYFIKHTRAKSSSQNPSKALSGKKQSLHPLHAAPTTGPSWVVGSGISTETGRSTSAAVEQLTYFTHLIF